uniref:Uncharacterized protein n=1 Tax=Cacopsylla melanoneura TaxID=428564 RepID=A0A8D8THH5_9HEMI
MDMVHKKEEVSCGVVMRMLHNFCVYNSTIKCIARLLSYFISHYSNVAIHILVGYSCPHEANQVQNDLFGFLGVATILLNLNNLFYPEHFKLFFVFVFFILNQTANERKEFSKDNRF